MWCKWLRVMGNEQKGKITSLCLLLHLGLCLGIGQFYLPSKSQKTLKPSVQHMEDQLWEMLTTTILF